MTWPSTTGWSVDYDHSEDYIVQGDGFINTVCNLNFSGYNFWTTRLKYICASRYLIHLDELCDLKQVNIGKTKKK
jgi:hypothetical protein